jgi:hypothetical protein
LKKGCGDCASHAKFERILVLKRSDANDRGAIVFSKCSRISMFIYPFDSGDGMGR